MTSAVCASARQLHLFDLPSPLAGRIGEAFFRTAPRAPGVYIMTGRDERVLYIGQSKNLRARLASYKNARPDRAPRKVLRLVSEVEKIVWEKCRSAQAARLRENELLRLHRPKFNSMNVWPKAYSYIWIDREENRLELGRTNEPKERQNLFGAFKGGAVPGFGAMLRLIWVAVNQPSSLHLIPSPLLQPRPPRRYCITFGARVSHLDVPEVLDLCRSFLSGDSNALVNTLENSSPRPDAISKAQAALHAADLATLSMFYAAGPKRNRSLLAHQGPCSQLIPQEELDDLLALASPTQHRSNTRPVLLRHESPRIEAGDQRPYQA